MTIAGQHAEVISPFPTLQPGMVIPWKRMPTAPFPFDQPDLHYYYLARNGVYSLAEHWGLRGQEILFPAYFHGICVKTLVKAGVNLRFYPVHSRMQVDIGEIAAMITPATRAVYLIHYLGFPGPVVELSQLCRDRGLLLIEDCALALLSRLGNRPLGVFGDAAVFCLYKTLPLPNGGALLVRTPGPSPMAPLTLPPLTSTAVYTASAVWRHLKFDGGGMGRQLLQKARNTARAMSGAMGVVPVGGEQFDEGTVRLSMSRLCHWALAGQDYQGIVERRRRNYAELLGRLREFSTPVLGGLPEGVCPLFYPVRTNNKPEVLRRLFEVGIEGVNFWSTMPPEVPRGQFPEVDLLRQTIVELPCHQDLTPESMKGIAERIWPLRKELI